MHPSFQQPKKNQIKTRSLFRRISYYFLMTLFSLAAFFVLGEIGVRFFYDPIPGIYSCIEPVEDDRHYVLKPNNTFIFNGLYEPLKKPVVWQTNEHGERIGTLAIKTGGYSDKIKIATYGDSEIFGWGLNAEETFHQQLEKRDNRIEAHNFGVPGYNVYQVAEHAVNTGVFSNPDILIYLVNENDFDISLAFQQFPKSSELLKRLIFVYYIFKKKNAQKLRRSEGVTKRFAAELVKMKKYCEANNTEFIVAFLNWDNRYVLEADPELKNYFFENGIYNKRVIDCSSAHGFPEIDKHYIAEAHGKIAELMLAHFNKYGLLFTNKD